LGWRAGHRGHPQASPSQEDTVGNGPEDVRRLFGGEVGRGEEDGNRRHGRRPAQQ
jgi:hypothetical protein